MKTLLVGGVDDVYRVVRRSLEKYGIDIIEHWASDRKRIPSALPVSCEAVIILKDMTSHNLADTGRDLAKKSSLPWCMTSRKWAVMHEDISKTFNVRKEEPMAQTPAAQAPAQTIKPKTRDELFKELQQIATTLMLEHNVLTIQIGNEGIQISVLQNIDLPLG
jgi:hypothetical protein